MAKKLICVILLVSLLLSTAIPAFALSCPNECSISMKQYCFDRWGRDGSYFQCKTAGNCQYRYPYYQSNYKCPSCGRTKVCRTHSHYFDHPVWNIHKKACVLTVLK